MSDSIIFSHGLKPIRCLVYPTALITVKRLELEQMINEWQPSIGSASAPIDATVLLNIVQQPEPILHQPQQLAQWISDDNVQRIRPWLSLSEAQWQPIIASLPQDALFPLAVLFTAGEQQLSGWQCGAKNPAIWIFRYLKQQGLLPEKNQIRWLKSLTDNRFIPYGSAL